MKIQKKQAIGEILLYVMVWTAIILVPVLNSQMMSEMHVNLENVLTAWRYIAPYLIIFLIHNAIIAPRYMLRRKYGKYLASNLALIISVFWLVQIYAAHLSDPLPQQADPAPLEAYRKAVRFYFKGADVRFRMEIDLCPTAEEAPRSAQKKILDIVDFL